MAARGQVRRIPDAGAHRRRQRPPSTRKGLDWTDRFSAVATALRELELGSAMLDGEIVVEDFVRRLPVQRAGGDLKSGRQDRFRYYVFDVLYLDGNDLTGATYLDRKQTLNALFASRPHSDRLALSEEFAIDGHSFFEHVSRLGLEGMISKRIDFSLSERSAPAIG